MSNTPITFEDETAMHQAGIDIDDDTAAQSTHDYASFTIDIETGAVSEDA